MNKNVVAGQSEYLTEENGQTSGTEHSDKPFTSQQLDILNDVTMNITVEIGKAKIKISDLLNLKKGSIVELHQEANEPLQIYANEKPIAKGIIITANGKYCVKII